MDRENIKKIKDIFIAPTVIVILILVVLMAFYMKEKDRTGISNGGGGRTTGEIKKDRVVEQSFLSPYNGLNGFTILFATYGRENIGNVTIQLYDKTDNRVVYTVTFPENQLQDNTFRGFSVPVQKNSKNHSYNIIVSSDADESNGITIWGASNDSYKNGETYINGLSAEMDILFKVHYAKFGYFLEINIGIIVLMGIIFLCLVLYRSGRLKNKLTSTVITCFVSSILMAGLMELMYSAYARNEPDLKTLLDQESIFRIGIFLIPSILIVCHAIFQHREFHDFLFKKRWWIALGIFVFAVICKINLSSVSLFGNYVQSNINTEFSYPLIGEARPIRSDEWLVSTPRAISASYSNYGMYNNIVRGTSNYNIAASGLYKGYSALSNIFNFGYYFFGVERGLSWKWCGLFIMSFMLSFEMALIVSKGKRMVALLGGCLIALSPFNLWWSLVNYIISMQGIIVCGYYFFKAEKYFQKSLLALGVALCGTFYICALYPAWQVPFTYVLMAFVVWIVIENIAQIKNLKKYDYLIMLVAFIFMLSIVVAYLYDNSQYTKDVMGTVYPGARFEAGGFSLTKPSYYIQALLYPMKATINTSEAGVFFNLFPLPMIFGGYIFIRQLIDRFHDKESKIDILNAVMLIPTIFITIYCTVGFPDWLAKYSLMSYSFGNRAVDVLGLINVYFIIRLLNCEAIKKYGLPFLVAIPIVIADVVMSVNVSNTKFEGYIGSTYISVISIMAFGFGMALLCKIKNKVSQEIIGLIILITGISGLKVLPLTRGADNLLEKPASYAIREIAEREPEAKWIGYTGDHASQFVIANGGACINSVNYIPNMDLWMALDSEGRYTSIYNRYCHVSINFTEEPTSFKLFYPDSIGVNLSYSDIEKTGVKYIFSLSQILEESDFIDLKLIYQEDNAYIYEIIFL